MDTWVEQWDWRVATSGYKVSHEVIQYSNIRLWCELCFVKLLKIIENV